MQTGSQKVVSKPQIHKFSEIGAEKHPRSTFQRDYPRRMTMNEGYLVPLAVDEILPGDDLHVKAAIFARLATPIKPFMDNLWFESFAFFVPNRLVFDKWEAMQGAPINDPSISCPTLRPDGEQPSEGWLDYLGVNPHGLDPNIPLNVMWLRACNLIYREWFRDENLEPYYDIYIGSSDPLQESLKWEAPLFRRNKRKDYITSALPWTQKGTAPTLAFAGTAPLTANALFPETGVEWSSQVDGTNYPGTWPNTVGIAPFIGNAASGSATSVTLKSSFSSPGSPAFGTGQAELWGRVGSQSLPVVGTADMSSITGVNANQLRLLFVTQQILELDARGGTRYTENLYSRWGVIAPDQRLQRPELIGIGQSKVGVYAVPQTAPTTGGATPQGNLAAFGTMQSLSDHHASYAAREHGMLIWFCNIRADLTYGQKTPRYMTRTTRLDYYEPMMNGLGEFPIFNYEVNNRMATWNGVWGYKEPFSEYRFRDAEIVGKFRVNAPTPLSMWHLSQQLSDSVALNSTFIKENPPVDRVVVVTDEPHFLVDVQFSWRHTRVMPMRSNPGLRRL